MKHLSKYIHTCLDTFTPYTIYTYNETHILQNVRRNVVVAACGRVVLGARDAGLVVWLRVV